MNEIITSGIKRRHFLKFFDVTGTSANAVFNATGKRLRDLPLTTEKLYEV